MSSADPLSRGVEGRRDVEHLMATVSDPTQEELAVLSVMERFAFRLVHRMNQGRWKRFWTWCQCSIGAGWIHLATYNLMRAYGLEHVSGASHERPILLVANHRSFFDMYTVSALLFRRTGWPKRLFFPVRSRFFYESPVGLLVNMLMGWWSMYPPIFAASDKRLFDKYSVRRLAQLCQTGAGHIIGFHPEGTRNRSHDPYSYLRAQPGVGKLIKDAAPQVIPVFIAGLGNNLPRQILGNWTGGEPIRIHFGPPLELSEYLAKKDHVRTYKEIADFVMSKIAELGEEDRAIFEPHVTGQKAQVKKERELRT
ncbi:MAG TPA: lysophospholipid acyltransferase family protein [Pyrinomonadaceae bacterium]|jgi:1-acyl-sn-glycerol-3-phosphate acyltransferase|nr:lysophospholipid acyltransferase family protein [Pyrinomonadaceae bacterium]